MSEAAPRRTRRRFARAGVAAFVLFATAVAVLQQQPEELARPSKSVSSSNTCMISYLQEDCLTHAGCEWRDDFGGRCRLDVSFRNQLADKSKAVLPAGVVKAKYPKSMLRGRRRRRAIAIPSSDGSAETDNEPEYSRWRH